MNIKVISSLLLIIGGTLGLIFTLRESGYNDPARIFIFGLLFAVGLYLAWLYGKTKK